MSGRGVVAILLAVSAAACGLGDKQHRADAIVKSVDKVFAAGSARGTLAVRVRLLKVPDIGTEQAAPPSQPDAPAAPFVLPPTVFSLGIDFTQRRAVLQRDAKHAEIFDGLDFYATRLGISDRDVRPWLRLRLEDLEEGTGELRVPDDNPVAIASAISPVVLVELAAGALAGSIERGEPATLAGVPVTRYRAAFDVEKTLEKTRERSYPEDTRDAIETAFDLLTVKSGVNPGTAWLDAEGRLRRFRLQLKVSRQRDFVFGVEFDLALADFGAPVEVKVPGDAAILEADSLIGFLRAVVPELASEDAA